MTERKKSLHRDMMNQDLRREMPNGSIRAVEGDDNGRKFILSFSSEEPYDRGYYIEILDHDEDSVDLTRLNEIGVVLYNHDRDKVIGKITRAWIEDGRGSAEIEFDDDDVSNVIYEKVKNGTLKGVSVGYRINKMEEVTAGHTSSNGKFEGPCNVATSWEPFEISIVSVPADPTVGVGREMEEPVKQAPSLSARQLQINLNKLL